MLPRRGESESDFVSRFVSAPEACRRYPDGNQRLAAAHRQFSRKNAPRLRKNVYKFLEGDESRFALDAPPGKVSLDQSAMSATGIFATNTRDRQGDVIDISGIGTTAHQENPVVLLDHGMAFPTPLGVTRSPGGEYMVSCDNDLGEATQTTYFSQKLPEAEQVYHLICEGILRANSIGFKPLRWQQLPVDPSLGMAKSNKRYTAVELVEVSWVGVPANRECVMPYLTGQKIFGKSLAPCIKSFLQPFAVPRKYISTGVTLEKAMGTKAMSSIDETAGAALRKKDEKEADDFVETPDADVETKDDFDATLETIEETKEPLGAETLRDLHADLAKVHKVYGDAAALVENEAVKNHLSTFLESLLATKEATASIFNESYPDLTPLSDATDEPHELDESEHAADEAAPSVDDAMPEETPEGVPEVAELPEEDEDDDEDFMEGITKGLSTKAMSKDDMSAIEECKAFLEELAGNEKLGQSHKAALKYHFGRMKDLSGKHKKEDPDPIAIKSGLSRDDQEFLAGLGRTIGRVKRQLVESGMA